MGKSGSQSTDRLEKHSSVRLLVVSTSGKTDAIALSPSVIASAVLSVREVAYSKGNVSLGHHGLKQGS